MKTFAIICMWSIISGGVLYALFAPTSGILNAGPGACLGIALLGASMCTNASDTQDNG